MRGFHWWHGQELCALASLRESISSPTGSAASAKRSTEKNSHAKAQRRKGTAANAIPMMRPHTTPFGPSQARTPENCQPWQCADFTGTTDKNFASWRLCVRSFLFRPEVPRPLKDRRKRILTQRRQDAKEQQRTPYR